ncbi:MAG: glycosyl transferase family 1 [Bacteroidia bacterium]|nr:MAG: glycosyl transferase family 1 [Bacteroidia bacterium]
MKILLVSSYLPYPLINGGHIRLYNLLKSLKHRHEITLICEKREYQTANDIEAVEKVCKKVITFPRRKQWSIANILKTGFSDEPFLIVGHKIAEMKMRIKQELQKEKYDLIHIETSYVFQNVPQIVLPTVLVEHNIEYLVYKRFAQKAPFFLKPFLLIDVNKLKKKEEDYWRKATRVVAVSSTEKSLIEQAGVQADLVPNGVDLDSFKFKNIDQAFHSERKQFLFIGDYKWMQNRDAVVWLIKEIWPNITKQVKEKISLRIVGRNIPSRIKAIADPTIIIEEDSPRKTEEIFSESFALLAPLRIGGGSQYKILESMAVGTPVITTPLGLSGLQVKAGRDILVGENVKEIISHAISLLNNKKLYSQLALHGRKQIEKEYDWNSISQKLDSVYQDVKSK